LSSDTLPELEFADQNPILAAQQLFLDAVLEVEIQTSGLDCIAGEFRGIRRDAGDIHIVERQREFSEGAGCRGQKLGDDARLAVTVDGALEGRPHPRFAAVGIIVQHTGQIVHPGRKGQRQAEILELQFTVLNGELIDGDGQGPGRHGLRLGNLRWSVGGFRPRPRPRFRFRCHKHVADAGAGVLMDHGIQPGGIQEYATDLQSIRRQGQFELLHGKRLPAQPGLIAHQVAGSEITHRELSGEYRVGGPGSTVIQPQLATEDPFRDRAAQCPLQIGIGRCQGDVGDIQPNIRRDRRHPGGTFNLDDTAVVEQQPPLQGKPGFRGQVDVGGRQRLDPQLLHRRLVQGPILETQADLPQRQAGQGHRPVPGQSGSRRFGVLARHCRLVGALCGSLRRPVVRGRRSRHGGRSRGGPWRIHPGRLDSHRLLGASAAALRSLALRRRRCGGCGFRRLRSDPGVLEQIEGSVGIQPGRQLGIGQGQGIDLQALLRPVQRPAVQVDARQFEYLVLRGVRQGQIPDLYRAIAQAQLQTLDAVQADVPGKRRAAPGQLDRGICGGHIGGDPRQRQARFDPGVGAEWRQGRGPRQAQTAGIADPQLEPVVAAGVGQGGEFGDTQLDGRDLLAKLRPARQVRIPEPAGLDLHQSEGDCGQRAFFRLGLRLGHCRWQQRRDIPGSRCRALQIQLRRAQAQDLKSPDAAHQPDGVEVDIGLVERRDRPAPGIPYGNALEAESKQKGIELDPRHLGLQTAVLAQVGEQPVLDQPGHEQKARQGITQDQQHQPDPIVLVQLAHDHCPPCRDSPDSNRPWRAPGSAPQQR
jgi:hypothetical protein